MSLEKIVEEQIQRAMAEGEFENLSGKGKPLELESYFQTPEPLRMGYAMLKSAHCVPQEVELLKEIEELQSRRHSCNDPEQKRRLERLIQEKILAVNVLLEKPRRKNGS